METLPKDMLYQIAKDMKIRDFIHLCIANKRVNEKICKNNDVWRYRLDKEFPNWGNFNLDKLPIDSYVFLYQLKILKKKLNLQENIYELYIKKRFELLYLSDNKLTTIPKEIGNLSNLQELYLRNNRLETIPKEIGNLFNLRVLYLYNNKLEIIPKEIGNLSNLQILYLSNNQLKDLPKEIGNLLNLQELYLTNNQLKEIPEEIGNLSNLQELELSYNQLEVIPKEITDIRGVRVLNK